MSRHSHHAVLKKIHLKGSSKLLLWLFPCIFPAPLCSSLSGYTEQLTLLENKTSIFYGIKRPQRPKNAIQRWQKKPEIPSLRKLWFSQNDSSADSWCMQGATSSQSACGTSPLAHSDQHYVFKRIRNPGLYLTQCLPFFFLSLVLFVLQDRVLVA